MNSDIAKYFDYAAATPLLPEAQKAMQPFFSDRFFNPSAIYLSARQNREALESARHVIAQGLGARLTEIVFSAGGTEANNLAIKGIMDNFKDCHAVTSMIEHESVLEPLKNYDFAQCKTDKKGLVNFDSLKKCINDKTVLVSIIYANNEIGSIQQIQEVKQILDKVKKSRQAKKNDLPIYLHSDACQAANYLDMQVSRLGVDLMTINSGKIYGPKQCGVLYVKSGIKLKPLISGGGQEWNIRSGTENLPSIIGFATAWRIIRNDYRAEALRLVEIRDKFIKYMSDKNPGCVLNGPAGKKRLANSISLTFKEKDSETLLMQLDEKGYKVAAGSACGASNEEPSHVLKAIGLSDSDARGTLRITLGRYSTQESLFDLADCLPKLVA